MSIEITKMDGSSRKAFYDTLLTFWDQRWNEDFQQDFLEWRYALRSDGETLVAMSGSKCIGLIDTFIRPYVIAGREVLVREPCDWYCLPGNRGVGMRLLKYLISQREPLLGVGLPKAAVAMAPRLNWKHLADTCDFVLPISARRMVGAILRKAKLGDGSVSKYIPSSIRMRSEATWAKYRQKDWEARVLAPLEWPLDQLAGANGAGYAVTPLLTRSYVRWLASGPNSLGPVFCLGFWIKGTLSGLTICRVELSKVGRKARLIHLQSSDVSVEMLQWMIAENIQRAAQLDAESVHCRSSCPITNAALTSLRFYETAKAAVIVGFNDMPIPAGPTNITFVRGDDAMIPSLIAE